MMPVGAAVGRWREGVLAPPAVVFPVIITCSFLDIVSKQSCSITEELHQGLESREARHTESEGGEDPEEGRYRRPGRAAAGRVQGSHHCHQATGLVWKRAAPPLCL